MSEPDIISPYNIKQTSDENKKKVLIGGLLVDSIPDSSNYHQKNYTADSKENY